MENIFYLISAHSQCIEGIRLTRKSRNHVITGESIGFAASDTIDFEETSFAEPSQWSAMIAKFLDQQQWKEHSVSFLLPAEDVLFRKITFPFQERKKVEQALPYELEEEIMNDLSECSYSTQIYTMPEQNSEALVFLIGKERLKKLQKLCLERNLLIRNVDCSAYALYRSLMSRDKNIFRKGDIFQIYLGGDEAFVNTIRDGRLDQIKIFPSRIPIILKKHLVLAGNSLPTFLNSFAKNSENDGFAEEDNELIKSYSSLKQELHLLCSQLTLHLRIKNYVSESEIEIQGVFGPMIKWDGVVFKLRSFPLPESEAFSERSAEDNFNAFSSPLVNADTNKESKIPVTLEELMEEAKQREKSNADTSFDGLEAEINSFENPQRDNQSASQLTSVKPESSLLSLLNRKHWGVLGELKNKAEEHVESHQLSLYHESTPWKRYLRRNRTALASAAGLILIISLGFFWQTSKKIDLLQQQIKESDLLMQTELRSVLPKTSDSTLNSLFLELKENIEQRKSYIKKSKKFESRSYHNLNFLKIVSSMLREGAPFRVDSLEYGPERFSLSGTIDSYERLQILKTNLKSIEEFKSGNIVESNRKSPDGIIYRISIDLN